MELDLKDAASLGCSSETQRIAFLECAIVRSSARVPSVPGALLFIGVLKAALWAGGLQRTWRWIRRHAERMPATVRVDPACVACAEYGIARGAALYPGRALCLERSLALYHYLRRRGVAVEFRMGVQTYPFGAHAWVEYRGHVINDVPEHVKRFHSILGAGT
jgi:hypothetical protein